MKAFIQQLFKDKLGSYSMRELVIAILLLSLVISWIGRQFFGKDVPEFMFFSFSSLIAAGCFGYTFEKHGVPVPPAE
jgi:choline-glycine betaine transporter